MMQAHRPFVLAMSVVALMAAAAHGQGQFMAPGVAHCAGDAGPQPPGQLEALLSWVEDGQAPETLLATRRDQTGVARTRPLCQYPTVAKHKGSGSTDDAANFLCSSGSWSA